MFMFRRRKTATLTRKLLKKRRPPIGVNGPVAVGLDVGGGVQKGLIFNNNNFQTDTKQRDVEELLKTLQDNQLEVLLVAVNTRGTELGNCVLLPKEQTYEPPPHLLFCQYWRWPEVRHANELKRLPQCSAAGDMVYTCCNPYHWSRLCQAEVPPPPYSRTNEDRIRPEDRAPSELPLVTRNSFESLTTSGESMVNRTEWCRLRYWEMSERVGPFFPVELHYVNIFSNSPYGVDGLSLEALPPNRNQTESSRSTRAKIGLGVTLSRDATGAVWLYNRSEQPVFVDSMYLKGGSDDPYSWPTRIPPDHCICVHVPELPRLQDQTNFGWDRLMPRNNQLGPAPDPNSIRISFVKGWGSRYHRPEIIYCPCWFECMLTPDR